eukprot:m.331647 g.331647  ORF g.331647 m.331647 type:complete len:299 (+) comp16771_c0_seq1:167-1063(+)
MSLYPSLEDMKVDTMAHIQLANQGAAALEAPTSAPPQYPGASAKPSAYGDIMSEMSAYDNTAYGGLDLSSQALATQMPMDHVKYWQQNYKPLATITQANDLGLSKAVIKQGIRQVVLAKDQNGKLGVAVDAWDKGIFIAFVWQNSAAAMAGLRFGDQILQINDTDVAGWTQKQTLTFLKKADPSAVRIAVRDRPFMRTITCQKDATNHCGFLFTKGEITALVKESSAARNGIMTHHQIIEVNAQCVVGLTDKELLQIIQESPMTITLTITPKFVYKHLVSKIGFSTLKKYMNHTVPEY